MPQKIEVDISALKAFGHVITAKEIRLPKGVTLVVNPDDVIASVYEPKEEVAEETPVDLSAIEVVQKAGERLGVRIAFLVNLLNPGAVVIGGGIEAAGQILIEAIKKMVRLCAFEEMANAVKIVPARLGKDAVALGAASLVIRDVFASV